MGRMPERAGESYHTRLGSFRGLECGLIVHPSGGTEVYLDGTTRCREQLVRDNPGPRAVLNALERLANGYESGIGYLKAEIAVKEGQLRDYETRLGKRFEHEAFQSELADLRDRLKLSLSEHAPEGGESVADLAEKIKALRASVTVEAAPVRVGIRKAIRAERPVTQRIRERRAAEQVRVEPVAEVIPLPVANANPVREKPESPSGVNIPAMYQERGHAGRVARRRQEDGGQLRMF